MKQHLTLISVVLLSLFKYDLIKRYEQNKNKYKDQPREVHPPADWFHCCAECFQRREDWFQLRVDQFQQYADWLQNQTGVAPLVTDHPHAISAYLPQPLPQPLCLFQSKVLIKETILILFILLYGLRNMPPLFGVGLYTNTQNSLCKHLTFNSHNYTTEERFIR